MQDEIFHLTWFDVDLPRGVIHIRVSKNGKDRFVPINQTAVQCWKDYDTPASTSSQVRKQKDVWSTWSVDSTWRRRTQESKDFRFHDLRHSGHADGCLRSGRFHACRNLGLVRSSNCSALNARNGRVEAQGSREFGQTDWTKWRIGDKWKRQGGRPAL